MDDGTDTGPVVSKEWFEITPGDTGLTLFTRTQHVAIRLLHKVLQDILTGQDLRPVVQDLSRLRVYRRAEALDGQTPPAHHSGGLYGQDAFFDVIGHVAHLARCCRPGPG